MTHLDEQVVIMDSPTESIEYSDTLSLWDVIRRDRRANRTDLKSQFILFAFRLSHLLAARKTNNRLLRIAGFPVIAMYRVLVQWFLCVDIPAETQIGAGLKLYHGQALVVNQFARIGRDCTLRHCTTIGSKTLSNGEEGPSPMIGDRVDVGSNAVIIGGILIGDDVVIGAGSVVIRDVPSGAVVAGNPARVLYIK
ncbi:MAG: DapH/DapD/GlmU-related protein [Terracidiphilus sp.]|nr:DapH/DapD/GlmU-related protein [Terracidiphilus sp.]